MKREKKILIVEDDAASAMYLNMLLQENGYEVVALADTGSQAIAEFKRWKPDLVLMDIMLKEKMSGCEAALQIKQYCSDAVIIFLTAYSTAEMVEYAVESEAYGYLTKPYRADEILATIKLAFPHRCSDKAAPNPERIELRNGYSYHSASRCLMREGKEVPLSTIALKVIEILVKNRNMSVSNEQICSYVWGGQRSDATLRSQIYRIRALIGNDMIKNVNGRGYEILT